MDGLFCLRVVYKLIDIEQIKWILQNESILLYRIQSF